MSRTRTPLADRRVCALLVVFFCSGLSMGYFSPLVSALMKARGHPDLAVGLVGTVYYVFVAIGASVAGRRRCDVRRTLATSLALAGVFGALPPLMPGTVGVALARAGCGLAAGAYMSVAQAALLARATVDHRALVTGVQALVFAAGLAGGPLLGTTVYAWSPRGAFALGGAILFAAAVVGSRLEPEMRGRDAHVPGALRRLFFPLGAAFVYGFAEAVLLSVYPLSLLERALPVSTIGFSCSAFVVGGVASTLPVSAAADWLGRGRVLFWCALAGLVSIAALTSIAGVPGLVALSFVAGASVGPMYALALALIRDRLTEEEVPSGTAAFTTSFSAGCIAGPAASSVAMARLGATGVFVPTLVLLLAVVVQRAFTALGTTSRGATA